MKVDKLPTTTPAEARRQLRKVLRDARRHRKLSEDMRCTCKRNPGGFCPKHTQIGGDNAD